jgi:hypothetical protein
LISLFVRRMSAASSSMTSICPHDFDLLIVKSHETVVLSKLPVQSAVMNRFGDVLRADVFILG